MCNPTRAMSGKQPMMMKSQVFSTETLDQGRELLAGQQVKAEQEGEDLSAIEAQLQDMLYISYACTCKVLHVFKSCKLIRLTEWQELIARRNAMSSPSPSKPVPHQALASDTTPDRDLKRAAVQRSLFQSPLAKVGHALIYVGFWQKSTWSGARK